MYYAKVTMQIFLMYSSISKTFVLIYAINNSCKMCCFRDVSTLLIPIKNFNNHIIPLQKKKKKKRKKRNWKLFSLSQIYFELNVGMLMFF